jgi:hypothetical protein
MPEISRFFGIVIAMDYTRRQDPLNSIEPLT